MTRNSKVTQRPVAKLKDLQHVRIPRRECVGNDPCVESADARLTVQESQNNAMNPYFGLGRRAKPRRNAQRSVLRWEL